MDVVISGLLFLRIIDIFLSLPHKIMTAVCCVAVHHDTVIVVLIVARPW